MTEEQKIQHETLTSTLQHFDSLVEQHSGIILIISAALLGFASSHLDSPIVVYLVSGFGIVAAVEWLLKITRHKQIFSDAHNKLVKLEDALLFKTARPLKKFNGFTILQWFSGVFICLWIALIAFEHFGTQTRSSTSQTLEDVLGQLSATSAMPNSKWDVLSLNWDPSSSSYEMVVELHGTSDERLVRYDAIGKRLILFEKFWNECPVNPLCP